LALRPNALQETGAYSGQDMKDGGICQELKFSNGKEHSHPAPLQVVIKTCSSFAALSQQLKSNDDTSRNLSGG